MAGETQRMHAVKELDAGSKLQDEGTALEQQSDKTTKESSEHFSSTGTEAKSTNRGAKVEKLEKKRECPQQREAVIRPQQAGKIDFKSLQNRSKFASERTWSSGKGSPQSPSGKGRSREKGKRAGKTERGNPQQLYRLSITNSRSNPTIGIAYPQQKVPPPKTLDTGRGPISGSYRFHVPSIPEREAELQQEELNYSRCFQEASANITSPSYTSQALGSSSGTSSHPHPPMPQQQQPASMENNSTQPGSQLILTDFQLSGSNAWQSAEKTFNGANYGVSPQKSTEANKAFVPGPFQYGYNFLEESTSDSFPCEQAAQSQDVTDSNLSSVHVTQNSFTFAPGEGQNIVQNNTQFSNEQRPEDRTSYPHPPQSQFIEGVSSSIQYPRNLSEDSTSSDSSGSISQQSEQGKTALPESADPNGQVDSRDAAITSGSKRNCHPKDTDGTQRTLIQGSVHHARNVSQGAGSQMHFSNKTFTSPPVSNIHTGPMSFDKSMNTKALNRLPRSWEGPNKTYSPADQSAIQYTDMNDRFQFQNQTGLDQRPNISKNSRMSWQQIRPNSAMQNRIELSRQASSQKLAYMVAPSDWQDDSKSLKHSSLKNLSSFQNSRTGDGFANQRQDPVKHSSNTVSTFKVEMSHAQVCDSKNKAVFFGLNQSLTAATRNYSYPLQGPPMGLMMVSPYESPLPSPVHNAAPGSTCSSISPASTSPINISSEDSQVSKSAPPHTFYHQPQLKTQLPSDHLSSHPHQFQSDASRNLPYPPDKAKDDMMAYLQNNNAHPKTTMEGNKGYMDSFGVEHHQPPPPYSLHAHQLLATSLATANLDQLDMLLTCKQCDQNFHNWSSFLSHKQYCTQHTFAQNDLKDMSKVDDSRKLHPEPVKVVSSASNVSMLRCPSDLHLSLLGLNKNGELLSDSETKGDTKDDPMKLSLFSSAGNLPELEMDDAKLDSLITEALNGLGYQSDNAEIDSSFIDAFADDDLTTVKATSSKQCQKTKESLVSGSKNKPAASDERSSTQGKYFYDSDVESPETDKQYTESKLEKISLNLEQDEKINIKKVSHKNSRNASREKTREQDSKVKEGRKLCKSEDENTSTQRIFLSSKFSERCGVKSFQDSSALRGSTPSQASTSPTSRTAVKESKRKNTGGGTWSKELIHKIVQQKNKLHKLHVKGTKNLQFSLVMERLPPTVQNPAFVEYDYVSDSDDECEPVKIASQGRLNQSSRCKYTYTKECKWRARSERDQAAWRHESKECFEVKKSEEVSLSPEKHGSHQRLRRRGSRSSTSSELSTSVSVSSDSINSPKSTDRTDSDCERKTDIIKKESPEWKTYERSSPQKCKESSTLALTFTKSVKKYNTDKAIFPDDKESTEDPKKCHSHTDVTDSASSSQKAKDTIRNLEKSRSSHTRSREKLVSHRKEISTAGVSERHGLQRANNLCPAEPARRNSADTKPLQYDSPSAAINKEPDFNIDRSTKDHQKEGPQVTQPAPSDKHSDGVCMVKEAITAVTDLDARKPASLCASLMDEVCLSPCESQGPLIQKDTLHLMPYPLDQEQGLMKSPLSFDTSSMFGDLTGFDSGIYSDMPIQKEGFHSIENTADKKEEFVSSFSTFLEQRDWNLIVSPVLPEEISQYKGNTEKSNEKKPDYGQVLLSLPEKIIDYGANLTSCASEHELEIKRIVNELENQLQTTKLESPPLLAQDPPKQLQMSKFSPLRLGDESESEDIGLDIRCPVQTIDVPVTRIPPQPFAEQGLPWSSPFQFEIMGAHHSPHTPIHNAPEALGHFTEKEDDTANLIARNSHIDHSRLGGQKSEVENVEREAPIETKEDILEQKRYTENLIKSLEVISDSIFKKEPTVSEPKEVNVTSLTSQQHQEIECQAADAVEREDHSEKEAITKKENILSPPNTNERKDDIAFILNESQSSLSSTTDPTVDGNQPISTQPTEPSESNNSQAETTVAPKEDITESNNLIEPAHCSSVATHDSYVAEDSCRNNNAEDNLNRLFKIDSDGQELLNTDDYKEAEVVTGVAGQAGEKDFGGEMADVMKTAMLEQPTDNHAEPGHTGSSHPGEPKVEQSNKLNGAMETAKQDHLIGLSSINYCSPAEFYTTASPANDMSVEIVTTDKPCSPILVESNIDSDCQCSAFQYAQVMEGKTNLLILSQPDSDSCKVTPTNDSLKPGEGLSFDTADKQEDILNVQDIKEQLPVDFMASHQNSPCGKEPEQSHCLFLNSAPLTSPLLATSPQTPIKALEEISCQSQSKCSNISMDKSSVQNVGSPLNKDETQDVKEALRSNEQLSTSAEMEYSLDLDLEIIECKIPSSEITSHSPHPVSSVAEPPKMSEGLEKREPMYDLSPFHYNSISDEHPPVNQYDYIPISPASKPEENPDINQSSRDYCEPCDLSINPALIFNKAETGGSLNLDPAVKLNLSAQPLILQQSMKFTSFSLRLPAEIQSKDSSAHNLKKDLEMCHDPFEPAAHLHTCVDLQEKVEAVNLDPHLAEDSTLLKKDISDGPPTPKLLVICENEQMPLPLDSSEKQTTIETGQCSTSQQIRKEISQQKTQSNTQQRKVLCEICFMCFRTVPGLKRHKAVKHLVRAEKHIGSQNTSNHQGTILIYEASQTTEKEHKDDSQTRCQTKIDGLPETSSTLISKAAETESVLEEMAAETSAVAVDEIVHQNLPPPTKAKKINKARKNKTSEVNMKPDPFPDEILNLLKTDILQALTPDFQRSGQQGEQKSAEDQVKINDRNGARTEEFPPSLTSSSSFDSEPLPLTTETNVLNETMELNQIADMEEMRCVSTTETANGRVCADNNVESTICAEMDIIRESGDSRNTLCAVEEMHEQKQSEESLAQEILRKVAVEIKCEKNSGSSDTTRPLSCLSSSPRSRPSASPDLNTLLDDDTTFSQLFPRDDEAKRKKCPRVYSKRNKRHKLSHALNVSQDYPPSETFVQNKDQYMENQAVQRFADNQANHCGYETISVDDAIMLNMCHNSTTEEDAKLPPDVKQGKVSQDVHVHENINELCTNPLESTIDKSSIEWSGSSGFSCFDTEPTVTCDSNSKPETSTAPSPVALSAAHGEPSVTESVQSFHSIDIQAINTTFQLPDIQFFDSNKEISVAPPIAAVGVENRDDDKSKGVAERRGRKRQDAGMKVKDKQYKCKVCFTWFLTLGELNFHKLSHNPSPPPTCYMCVQRKFSSREQLRDHLREKHAKNKTGIWTCGMCLKEISDVWMYNEHLREHATQFARRGQTQGSMLDIPGCFMQETAVKNFITSIMQHRPSKASRDSSKATKEQDKGVAADREGKSSELAEPKFHRAKNSSGAGGKQGTLTPLEVLHKAEAPKVIEMHPNCKDPSRDCHHCGKQFPKPFKLQRHLVVHNLEKIFLCHKCPVSYQEAQALKDHLKRAHEEVEELDSKHTILYTCELCADVMHVIKKSFICSTCNYTFSKKEQFDRHMEKHLSGGNKIFKFRGVHRPAKASASREDEGDAPAGKKRRTFSDSLQENSSDSGIASVSPLRLNQTVDMQSSKAFVSTAEDSTQTTANDYHGDASSTNVKTEDVAEDYTELLVELEKCIHMGSSEPATPKKEEIEPTPSPNPDEEGKVKSVIEPCDVKEENESVCIRAETNSRSASKESSSAGEEDITAVEDSAEADTAETGEKTDLLPPAEDSFFSVRENLITTESAKHNAVADVTDQQMDDEQGPQASKDPNNDNQQQTEAQDTEQVSGQVRDNVSTKATEATPVLHPKASVSNEDKESPRPQKKRKEMKSPNSLQRASPPATQENMDSRAKKKFRPSKCTNPSLQRKPDGPNEYAVLSSVRDDAVSNKLINKCKTSNMGLQSKRSLLDICSPKKAEIVTPLNGDYKTKKGTLGRPLHSSISKVSSVPMNNTLNKSRPKMGVRSMESHSYRTAESQNHLLSQLFGQKLTSFKIPLRKDTSESIN